MPFWVSESGLVTGYWLLTLTNLSSQQFKKMGASYWDPNRFSVASSWGGKRFRKLPWTVWSLLVESEASDDSDSPSMLSNQIEKKKSNMLKIVSVRSLCEYIQRIMNKIWKHNKENKFSTKKRLNRWLPCFGALFLQLSCKESKLQ